MKTKTKNETSIPHKHTLRRAIVWLLCACAGAVPFTSSAQTDLSFTNNPPLASYYIDLSHYNYYETPVLSANKTYCFRASGRGGVGPLDRGEAMADAAFYPSFQPLTAETGAPANTWEWLGRTPFRPTPDVFDPSHIYYFYFHGSNATEVLRFQDSPYTDNVGGFSVDLFFVSDDICTPHKATATATIVNGFVVGATIEDSGCGYTNAPAVLIQGGGGSGATATATVSNGGVVAIIIVSAGSGYTNAPTIRIASPPFVPTVSIAVSRVKVTQNVVLGWRYVLEASTDLVNWAATGPEFTADSESIVSEFEVDVTGRFFRIRRVP